VGLGQPGFTVSVHAATAGVAPVKVVAAARDIAATGMPTAAKNSPLRLRLVKFRAAGSLLRFMQSPQGIKKARAEYSADEKVRHFPFLAPASLRECAAETQRGYAPHPRHYIGERRGGSRFEGNVSRN
jgi:hypothetical protein